MTTYRINYTNIWPDKKKKYFFIGNLRTIFQLDHLISENLIKQNKIERKVILFLNLETMIFFKYICLKKLNLQGKWKYYTSLKIQFRKKKVNFFVKNNGLKVTKNESKRKINENKNILNINIWFTFIYSIDVITMFSHNY